jgi:hypothetical protein
MMADDPASSLSAAEREESEKFQLCGLVTDYDDSIGGEGEILCGARLTVGPFTMLRAECAEGHKWVACDCGGPTCEGWKVDRG